MMPISEPLNLESIDKNLQAIRVLEGAWMLPGLPSEVAFDLASSPIMNTASISSLMIGLDEDIENAQKQQPYQVANPGIWTPNSDQYSPGQQVGRLIGGVTGSGPPKEYNQDAVVDWKRRAVLEGYLDLTPEQINDPRWLPEYGPIAGQMRVDQMRDEFSGDKPSSIAMPGVMNFIEDWISPRGLYRAAVNLDVMWDVADIYSEGQEWGDKWRRLLDDPSSPKAWIDALTGPIDDIVFPIVNVALMFAGVGEIMMMGKGLYAGARAGQGAWKGVQAARATNGLYRGMDGLMWAATKARLPRGGEALRGAFVAGDMAADAERFKTMSLTASALRPRVFPAGGTGEAATKIGRGIEAFRNASGTRWVDEGMQAWRQKSSVVMAKKFNQQVYRLGITSNLESLVDDKRGHSLATTTSVDDWLETAFSNPAVDWGVDLFFFPPNIFEPGTIARTVGAGSELGKKAANLVPGINFDAVSANQKLTIAWHDPVRADILENGGDVKLFDKSVTRLGLTQALADQLTGGNKALLGQGMSFVTIMAVLDGHAREVGQLGKASLDLMKSGERNTYLAVRRKAVAQIRMLDPGHIDDIIDIAARYGTGDLDNLVDIVDESGRIYKKVAKVQNRTTLLRERMIETAEEAAARGVGTQENHVRLYGYRPDSEVDTIRWSTNRTDALSEDPFVIDVSLDEIGRRTQITPQEAGVHVNDQPQNVGEYYQRRYNVAGDGNQYHQVRLSEIGSHRQFKQDKILGFQLLADGHNAKRKAFMTTLLNGANEQNLESYIYETLPTFGRWHKFVESMTEIDTAMNLGQLDNARYSPALSPSGNRMSLFPDSIDGKKMTQHVDEIFMNLPDDIKIAGEMNASIFNPLVRNVEPGMGRFTIAGIDTVVKQEALSHWAVVKRVVNNARALDELEGLGKLDGLAKEIDDVLGGAAVGNKRLRALATDIAAQYGFASKREDKLFHLLQAAEGYGVTMKDLRRSIERDLLAHSNSPIWAERFRVPSTTGRGGSKIAPTIEIVESQLKELLAQSHFMASTVEDVPAALVQRLADRNYKLVHGVEFAHVDDMAGLMPEFAEAQRHHIRQVTLQNFFGRKDPIVVRQLKTQKIKSTLWSALKREHDLHPDKMRINPGPNATAGETDIKHIVDDLHDMLYTHQRHQQETRDAAAMGFLSEKAAMRVGQARVPLSIERLASDMGAKKFYQALNVKGYTDNEARAIFKGVMKAQNLGFENYGLFAIETYLRSNPNGIQALRLLGQHHVEGSYLSTLTAKGGATMGAIVGGGFVSSEYAQRQGLESGEWNAGRVAAGIAGGVMGVGAAHGLARVKIGGVGLGATASGTGKLAKYADTWEDSTKWLKYAYMADGLANMRDLFRFSLSPLFDASRYSEAVILGQLADLPPGVRNLKVNQSPKGFKRILRQEAVQVHNMDPHDATRYVNERWHRAQEEFASAARGDFEAETIDNIGRKFSSVGVLAFSPQDWMTAMFANLRQAGVKPTKAYEIVRDVHTYGTTGRSSAEMSMNMVFFPFSFTKKVMRHLGQFFSKDMGRLVVLHDTLKTYELLSEHYDLSNEFRDRLPILNRMARLNVLAYGIGPGRFGGVNASLIGTARNEPILGDAMYPLLPEFDEITNMFMPQSVVVNTEEDANSVWDVFRQALPALNDVNQMVSDVMAQAQVVTSSQHMTNQASNRRAWQEWRDWQEAAKVPLEVAGLTWAQGMRQPEFAVTAAAAKTNISKRHPSWKNAIGDGIARATAIDMELDERLLQPKGTVDYKLQEFHTTYSAVKEALGSNGFTFDNPEEIPPEIYSMFRNYAIELAREDPAFLRLYNRFYARRLGDITTELV